MRYILFLCVFFISCTPGNKKSDDTSVKHSLDDFFVRNPSLEQKVDEVFEALDEKERIAQMIVTSAGKTGKPRAAVENLIKKRAIGGILMLSGEKQMLKALGHRFDSLGVESGALPFIYSSDAEPSLINLKIKGTTPVPKSVELKTAVECDSVAKIIAEELLSMDIHHNFAPVLDVSPNNEAITNRTFGNDSATVVEFSSAFVKATQEKQVVATVKHFPGHGLVSGDTHHRLVTIDGALKEVNNYHPLIDQGVISVMVGHIAIVNNEKYNTNGMPASCSRVVVTDLLKKELGFEGIVVTDAMNMGALAQIENASLQAVQAGCDMILMEPNEIKLLESIYDLYTSDDQFRKQVDTSVKKILRLKACLNLL